MEKILHKNTQLSVKKSGRYSKAYCRNLLITIVTTVLAFVVPNTAYGQNAFLNSGSDPAAIEYDNGVIAGHSAFARQANGSIWAWGEMISRTGISGYYSTPGAGDFLTPQVMTSSNYPLLTSPILKYTGGVDGINEADDVIGRTQFAALTNDGLYIWGYTEGMLPFGIVPTNAMRKVAIGTSGVSGGATKVDGLPATVAPVNVKMLVGTSNALAVVANGGVWVLSNRGAMWGNGTTGAPGTAFTNLWQRVQTGVGADLTNVIAVRGTRNAFFALTADGQLYTWGVNAYRGNGDPSSERTYAVTMSLPGGVGASDIKMIQMSTYGDGSITQGGSYPSYYLLTKAGNVYALGDNRNRQLGDFTTVTYSGSWVRVKKSAAANDFLTNVAWISANGATNTRSAVNALTNDGKLWAWGSNDDYMLGGAVESSQMIPTYMPGGLNANDYITSVTTGSHMSMISMAPATIADCSETTGGRFVGHRMLGSTGNGHVTFTGTVIPTYTQTFDLNLEDANLPNVAVTTPSLSICGGSTANLSSAGATAAPSGLVLRWYTSPTRASGSLVSNPAAVPAGTYYAFYEKLNGTTTCTASATGTQVIVTAQAALNALNDSYNASFGVVTTTASVLVNDTRNGVAVNAADVNIAVVGTPPTTGISLNTTTGTVTVLASVAAGTYTFNYEIWNKTDTSKTCPVTATVTIMVSEKDTDGDGVPDRIDLDNDNDGILDANECYSDRVTNGSFTGATSAAGTAGWTLTGSWGWWNDPAPGNGAGKIYNENDTASGESVTQTLATPLFTQMYKLTFRVGSNEQGFTNTTRTASLTISLGGTTYAVLNNGTGRSSNVTLALSNGATSDFVPFSSDDTRIYKNVTIYIPYTYSSTQSNNLRFVMNSTGDDWYLDDIALMGGCDTDGDGIPDYLDLDSDNDGCLDALEGDDNVIASQLVSAAPGLSVGTSSTAPNQNLCAANTCVDAQGVPLVVNPGGAADIDGNQGQGKGRSTDATVSSCNLPNFCVTGCNPNTFLNSVDLNTIEYDNFVSLYHSTIVKESANVFKVWGEKSMADGVSPNLVPMEVAPGNGYTYTGTPLRMTGGSINGSQQMALLTTDGLYAWGDVNTLLPTAVKNTSAFGAVSIGTSGVAGSNPKGLPAGVEPGDVKMLFGTYQTLAIVTCDGAAWVLSFINNKSGDGTASDTGNITWRRVKTSATNNLEGVVALRGVSNALMALTSSGELYTWGSNTYLGGSVARTNRTFANKMNLPTGVVPKMIGMTQGRIGGAKIPSYYLLANNGNLYSLGVNDRRQLGDGAITERTEWVRPQKVTNQSGQGIGTLTDIVWISPNEHDEGDNPNINVLTNQGKLWAWGFNNQFMIGGVAANTAYDPIYMPGGLSTNDKITAVETGGHTTMVWKDGETKFGYVGHKINGSMADGTLVNGSVAQYSFQTAIIKICGLPDSKCYKPGATTSTGVALDTKVGITSLGRAGVDADNWPMLRKGGWIALESKTKGFVPNRVAFSDADGNPSTPDVPVGITTSNFVEGMMVYDITNKCMKVYTLKEGDSSMAWHCMTTQTCPD